MRHIGAGYPRPYIYGYSPGTGVYGAPYHPTGIYGYIAGAEAPMMPAMAPHPLMAPVAHPAAHMMVHPPPAPAVVSPPWRPMVAPGSPPLGEGHVAIPLTAETFGGQWGNGTVGAPSGTTIIFSGRPQKPFKAARLIVRGTKSGPTAIGNLIGQQFVGTDLQQGELGNVDLESIGAATAFDTWISWKQAEPGVWIRIQSTLTAFPTGADFETYTITVLGHYLH